MIGKIGAELDLAKLDMLCQERKIQHQQTMLDENNSKLAEIARSNNPPSEEATRPCGVEQEGQAYDVWHHILSRVSDPTDVENLWKVSEMFRDILRGKYIETRLPNMINLILGKRRKYLLPGQEDKTFLNLRLISKQCKKSVETICHSEALYRANLSLRRTERAQRIAGKLEQNPSYASSFFPGNLDVYEPSGMNGLDLEQFQAAIEHLLKLVGHTIHYFTYQSDQNSADIYHCLRKWVGFMPNLEHLAFARSWDTYPDLRIPPVEEIEPFPKLPLLRSIEEDDAICGVLPFPFVQRILEASPDIQKLHLTAGEYVREHSPPQVFETLVDLTTLQICPCSSFLQLCNLRWKLNRLTLYREDMTPYGTGEAFKTTVSSCMLFLFLKQFEDTLEHLEFHMVDFAAPADCCGCGYLELRNLKTLKFELHETFKNVNFLLYLEKLETLHIKVGDEVMWGTPEREKYGRILRGSFLGKSVWEVFPYLKWLRFFNSDSFDWPRG